MPSPFPGMDPFLEAPAYFGSTHGGIITYLREALQVSLPERYYADFNERLWVEIERRPLEPDPNVLRALAEPVVIRVPHIEVRESYLDIYTRVDDLEHLPSSPGPTTRGLTEGGCVTPSRCRHRS